jgi:hypothetical protein
MLRSRATAITMSAYSFLAILTGIMLIMPPSDRSLSPSLAGFYSPGLPRLQAQGQCVSWTISFCDFYFALGAGFDRACSFALSFRLFFRLRRLRSSSFLRSIFLCPPMMPPCLYWDELAIVVRIGEECVCVKY